MNFRETLLADLSRQWSASGSNAMPSTTWHLVAALGNQRFLPVVLCRTTSALWQRGLSPLAKIVSMVNQAVFGVEMALRSDIGPGLYFPHTVGGIVLGAERIGTNVTIYHGVTLGAAVLDVAYTPGARPVVGDNVVIASGAKVLGGVDIGDNAVVGANAVVVHDVAPNAVVGGVPARTISERDGETW